MTTRIARWICTFAWTLALVGAPRTASAQLFPPKDGPPLGEDYHVQVAGDLWLPSATFLVASESIGILGDDIDLGRDLGVSESAERFQGFRLQLRPAAKHKFKIEYTPLSYSASAVLTREFVFNGLRYRVGVPVETTLDWKMWRIGYEYDFIRRDWGYTGVMIDVRTIDSELNLNSPLGLEFARAQLPVPSLGVAARVYPVSFFSLTGELSFLKIPEADDYSARYLDINAYATLNFARWVAAQVGYHHYDINFRYKLDRGDSAVGGVYVSGLVRY
jgi:hypothetical protein